jgi:hypothetical protein
VWSDRGDHEAFEAVGHEPVCPVREQRRRLVIADVIDAVEAGLCGECLDLVGAVMGDPWFPAVSDDRCARAIQLACPFASSRLGEALAVVAPAPGRLSTPTGTPQS